MFNFFLTEHKDRIISPEKREFPQVTKWKDFLNNLALGKSLSCSIGLKQDVKCKMHCLRCGEQSPGSLVSCLWHPPSLAADEVRGEQWDFPKSSLFLLLASFHGKHRMKSLCLSEISRRHARFFTTLPFLLKLHLLAILGSRIFVGK